MDIFSSIEAEVQCARGSGSLEAAFRRWAQEDAPLRRYRGVESLISTCREGGSPEAADMALRSLCALAGDGDQPAGSLLLWLLLPGILSARAGLRAGDAFPAEDIDAELAAGIWEAATSIERSHQRVARRLVNAARWRVLRAMRESIEWYEQTVEFDTDPAEEANLPYRGEAEDILEVAVRDGAVSAEDAEVLMADRATIRTLAERLGLSLKGAQTRRHRARQRLRDWMETSHQPPAKTG